MHLCLTKQNPLRILASYAILNIIVFYGSKVMAMDFAKLQRQTARIVKQAAHIMKKGTGMVFEKSGAANLVTDADVRVQQYLQEKLSRLIPGSGFLCEEENVADTQKDYVWVIDPIDGSTNFV